MKVLVQMCSVSKLDWERSGSDLGPYLYVDKPFSLKIPYISSNTAKMSLIQRRCAIS